LESTPGSSTPAAEGHQGARPIEAIRKRDGRLVPFDLAKISAAIGKAMEAAGEADEGFAVEVAGVVEMALARRHSLEGGGAGSIPHIEEIQDLVENALVELGRGQTAKGYILYRDRRARLRDAVEVHHPAGGRRSTGDPAVRVQESEGSSNWSKGRIVAALMGEANLPRATAEDVASRVEQRVFVSKQKRISTGLIREMVDNELVDMGLTRALRRQAPLGLPRHDFSRILRGEALTPWEHESFAGAMDQAGLSYVRGPRALEVSTTRAISSEIMRRYVLEDVLGDGLAELHLSGDLSIEDMGAAQIPTWIAVPGDLLLSGEATAAAAFDLLDELADCARGASIGVVLEDPASVLQPLLRATRAGSAMGISAWLHAVRAISRGSGRRIDLGGVGLRNRGFLARLVTAMSEERPGLHATRLFLSAEELGTLIGPSGGSDIVEGAIEILLETRRLVPVWTGERRFAAPGCRRSPRERGVLACGGAIVLNLPRVARRAGPWRESRMFEELSGLVRASLEAARAMVAFQRRSRGGETRGFARMRTSFALQPSGLVEALRTLGDGRVDPDQGARLLGFLSEAARRYAKPGDPEIVVSSLFGERASARFAWVDAERLRAEHAGRDQGQLFHESEAFLDSPPETPYSVGFDLAGPPGYWPGEAEARLVATLPSGALYPLPTLLANSPLELERHGVSAGEDPRPNLGAWRRFSHCREMAWGKEADAGLFTLIPGGAEESPSAAPEDQPSSTDSSASVPAGTPDPEPSPGKS